MIVYTTRIKLRNLSGIFGIQEILLLFPERVRLTIIATQMGLTTRRISLVGMLVHQVLRVRLYRRLSSVLRLA